MQKSSKLAALSVYFLDNFALALVYPIFTPLLFSQHSTWLAHSHVKPLLYLGILIASFPLAQFIGAPIIGALADRKGRKKAFFLTLIAETLGFLLSAIAIQRTNYSLLLLSRFFTGFFAANLTVCLAVYADINTPVKASKFGPLMAAGGLSFICAILVGGLLSNRMLYHQFNPALPFYFTAMLSSINLLTIIFFFKETTTPTRSCAAQNLYKITRAAEYKNVRRLYLIYFFLMLAWMPTLQFLSPLLYLDYRVDRVTITGILAGVGIIWAWSAGFFNRFLSKHYPPQHILIFSLPALAIALFGVVKPYRLFLFTIFITIAAIGAALSWVNNITLISTNAKPAIQGKVFGLSQSIGSLAMICGPLLSSYLGSIDLHLIYFYGSLYILLGFVIFSYKH